MGYIPSRILSLPWNSLLGQSALRNLLLAATSVDLVVNWRIAFKLLTVPSYVTLMYLLDLDPDVNRGDTPNGVLHRGCGKGQAC